MEVRDILNDAIRYPLGNIKAVVIYLILSIILGAVVGGTVGGVVASASANNIIGAFGLSVAGVIIAIVIGFLIEGYRLDIVKYALVRDSDAPGIDFVRQFFDGIKLFIVEIIYYLIPIIIGAICSAIFREWLAYILLAIIFIIFGLAEVMAQCRLAKNDDLMSALSIGDAIADISRVGFFKLVAVVVVLTIVAVVVVLIGGLISQWNGIVGGIISAILGVYLIFVTSRASGLLYSEV